VQTGGKLDVEHYGLRIALLFQPKHYRVVGYGMGTARAAEAIWAGKSARDAGDPTSHGNGSAMRSAPLGFLLHKAEAGEFIDTVSAMSNITHASPRCRAASVAVAHATKLMWHGRWHAFDKDAFIDSIAEITSRVSSEFSNELKILKTLVKNQDRSAALKKIIKLGLASGEKSWHGMISYGVTQTTLWALYAVCSNPDSFVKCIAEAIVVGGDVDTTAAIAGGILGARVGLVGVPKVWANLIHDLDSWDNTQCCDLVKSVHMILK
jgi:ADP-ribosylglycohydrolase